MNEPPLPVPAAYRPLASIAIATTWNGRNGNQGPCQAHGSDAPDEESTAPIAMLDAPFRLLKLPPRMTRLPSSVTAIARTWSSGAGVQPGTNAPVPASNSAA